MCLELLLLNNSLLGEQFCMDYVNVQQEGDNTLSHDVQVIFPQFSFTCNGKITGIRARVRLAADRINYPLFQVWRPLSIGSMIYNKIGEVQLESDDQVANGTNNQLATIILTGNNTIEVQSGDVLGCDQPPDSRYRLRTNETNGHILYRFNRLPNSNLLNLSNAVRVETLRQPLIEFTIGKLNYILFQRLFISI